MSLVICTSTGTVLTITDDGKLIRGEVFASDDEASIAFLECLAAQVPSFLGGLYRRAEVAEARLVFLMAGRDDARLPHELN